MSLRHHVRFLVCLLLTTPCLRAQTPAPVQPKPQAPNLTAPLTPLSIQRGASVLMEDFNLKNINEVIKKEQEAGKEER